MGRVVWTVGWFLPVVSHPMIVWEVVVNTDCVMWTHRDGFPGVVWSVLVWSGGVWVGRCARWFRLRWAHGSGCLDRGVAPPGCSTPHDRVGGRGQHRLWDVVTPGRIPRRGPGWSDGVWVGRWGGSGCGGLMGRVVWTVGWYLPVVPHPVVVWEVVVNTDCGMWSHRDGFPGVVWSRLVWWCLGGTVGWFQLRWSYNLLGGLRNLEMRSSQLESGFTPLGLLNSSSTAHLPRRAPAGCARRVPYGALAYSPKTRLCALSGACFECPCARVPVFGSDLCLAYLQTFFPA